MPTAKEQSPVADPLVSDEVRSLVGVKGKPVTTQAPVSEEMLRRFVHGVMEPGEIHFDHAAAASSPYGSLVAPPLFPVHAFRRPLASPDPFDVLRLAPDTDGTFHDEQDSAGNGLPRINLPLKRVLNGGVAAEFFQLAKIGDVITAQSEYVDIAERTSRKGVRMVIIKVRTAYTNQDGDLLLIVTQSVIRR